MNNTRALYEQVSEYFQPLGTIEALVLTSFGLDVKYLEQSILPAFFPHLGDGPADEPHRPLFEYLEEEQTPISVMYDANNLMRGETVLGGNGFVTKELRWQAHPIARPSGCFHPKVILALVNMDDAYQLVIGVASANLTRPGWGHNVEVCVLETVPLYYGITSSLLVDAQGLIDKLLAQAEGSTALLRLKDAVDAVDAVEAEPYGTRRHLESYRTRLWYGQGDEGLSEWLRKEVIRDELESSERGWKIEVLSPYYSDPPPAFIDWAGKQLSKRHGDIPPILCYCPRNGDQFDIDPAVATRFSETGYVEWAEIPGGLLTSALKDEHGNARQRFFHAKVYRLWRATNEILVVGSANATTQGHRDNGRGNDEVSLVFSHTPPEGVRLKPWLRSLEREITRKECQPSPTPVEDASPTQPMPRISAQFDWISHQLRIESQDNQAVALYLGPSTAPLCMVPAGSEQTHELDSRLIGALFRSPTVKVTTDTNAESAWLCLVEETNLHAKPPAPSMERSVDDLIRDWQSGAEQRLADRVGRAALPTDLRDSSANADELSDDAAQDRLNDLFLAVYRFRKELETKVAREESVSDYVRNQVRSRLFGNGAMSLRYFADKVVASSSPTDADTKPQLDPVEAYIALLALIDATGRLTPLVTELGYASELTTLKDDLQRRLGGLRLMLTDVLEEEVESKDARSLVRWVEEHFQHDETITA